ncbi:uncharacterized protein [Elaeis guineensis]|uniref:Receptor-like protein kinase 5 n=1 Tax=Elaeis guineensis var. tenera TaxID=51953 RepID=A0A6I9RDV3_ELAGV|nr:receptor-like protein kinase 5 [Elaeis guineensis]
MVAKAISSSLLLLIIFFFSSLAASQMTTEDGERQILLRIKEDWGNPSVLSSWNDSTPISHCKWTGIQCSSDGSVTNISLVNQNITQPIPAAIGKLKSLSFLDLSYNNFTSSFPTSLYNCSNLLHLDLSQNYFVGVIPPNIYRLSARLTHLILSANNFTGDIPPSISRLSAIEYLTLDNNFFDASIPAELGNLSNLQTLSLGYNPFSSATIPSTFRNLTRLSTLWIRHCNLKGEIPEFIGELTEMTELDLVENSLSGSIPAGVWNLRKLRNLYLFANNLTGAINIDGPIGALGLEQIDISINQLNGSFPEEFGKLQNLAILFMFDNRFSGTLPDKLPPGLTWLDIMNNKFSGNIPSTAKSLQSLIADNNLLSGNVPAVLTGISELVELYLGGNQISGQIPPGISELKYLCFLSLRRNRLVGKIPAAIGSLRQLISLDLSINQLSDSIPPEIGDLKLGMLDLSSNRLSGEIPISLQDAAYNQSFLSNPSLCTSSELLNVPICKHGLQWKLRMMLIVLASLVSLMATVFAAFARRGRHGRSNGRVLPTRKMMSFYPLDFTKSTILSGLTEDNLIGSGGGGKVYRIVLENHVAQIVAVKKIWNSRKLDSQLEKEFESEVQILGSIRHANIVKLLCCVWSVDTKLLVYEYMENGSLDRWLHKKWRAGEQIEGMNSDHLPLLDWSTRLRIAVDVARGLCYMHHGCSPPVVHRDVKSSNILLDSEFRAKVADFGLARVLIRLGEANTVSAVAGTFGYMAPECGYSKKIDEKMDVYSFGVILLELTIGKKANDGGDSGNLAEWARYCFQEADKVINAIDQDIKNPTYVEEIAFVFKLGVMCTSPLPSSRPTIKDVLQILLHRQQTVSNDTIV